ncbi:hypothetical protein ACH5RR_032639 [Cinchona calisaya]|uniref:Reverse transcriptase domain-containing protein n=1 Tax=Cinchona calisaya TaxID=153742 RepID=A0ABD2YN30_9GENT
MCFQWNFFTKNWNVVKKDFVAAIQYCFSNEYMYYPINSTIITIIPKIPNPSKIQDYRPISCCNIIYKCYSKVLAQRLKRVLSGLVNNTQSPFMAGRSISDNILLMHDIVRGYHKRDGKPRCAVKVDLMKAYDTVRWEFFVCYFRGHRVSN